MKRGRKSESLTGGTGDVNPQQFILRVPQSGADTVTLGQFPLPIPRTPTSSGRATVMEILKVIFSCQLNNPPAAGSIENYIFNLTTNPNNIGTKDGILQDPRSLLQWSFAWGNATGVGLYSMDTNKEFDLTDAAGHGVLVAVDNLGLQVYTENTGVTNVGYARVFYRLKEVGVIEYVGIVQSQQ